MLSLPSSFTYNIKTVFSNGEAWLNALPSLIAECEERWSIKIGDPFKPPQFCCASHPCRWQRSGAETGRTHKSLPADQSLRLQGARCA